MLDRVMRHRSIVVRGALNLLLIMIVVIIYQNSINKYQLFHSFCHL